MTSVCVLARHNEDMDWTDRWKVPHNWRVTIVQKGAPVPNVGREQSSYLWWIITHYEELCRLDTLCFAQAWPFDHFRLFKQRVRNVDRFTPLGQLARMKLSEPFDQYVAWKWPRLLGEPFPGDVEFPAGSCFLVPAARVADRPRELYEALYDYARRTPEFHAHVLERLWPGVLADRVQP